jgi:hypothetical protein
VDGVAEPLSDSRAIHTISCWDSYRPESGVSSAFYETQNTGQELPGRTSQVVKTDELNNLLDPRVSRWCL